MLIIKIISIILAGYLGFYSFYWLFATLLGTGYKGEKRKRKYANAKYFDPITSLSARKDL